MRQIQERPPPPSRAFNERLAPYGGEFDVKRSPPVSICMTIEKMLARGKS